MFVVWVRCIDFVLFFVWCCYYGAFRYVGDFGFVVLIMCFFYGVGIIKYFSMFVVWVRCIGFYGFLYMVVVLLNILVSLWFWVTGASPL